MDREHSEDLMKKTHAAFLPKKKSRRQPLMGLTPALFRVACAARPGYKPASPAYSTITLPEAAPQRTT